MKAILKYILLSAIRDWFFIGLFLAIFSAFAVSSLVGFTTTTEEYSMQLVVFAGTARIILVCGMIIFICFHINRSFENKEINFILAKDISREKFIFSYWLGFNIIAFIFIVMIALIIAIFSKYNTLGYLQWLLSIIFETVIMSMFSVLSILILKSAVFSIFTGFGFYLISRLMGFFINIMLVGSGNKVYGAILDGVHWITRFISSVIPRLDLFGQTKWLVYGPEVNVLYIILLQFVIYVPIMFMVAFYDFKKKQF
jgi:ABC-type transport system involved in multi-copper enzyme maturation permease subunit